MSIIDRFFRGREELLNEIRRFEAKHALSLVRRLEKEDNEDQFLSTITEIQFGLFFNQYAHSIKYESAIGNKTPDWLIEMNGQTIIAEVARLNPSASDKIELDFDDNLMDAVQEINVGALLYFDYDEKAINRSGINFADCKALIQQWLSQPRQTHETVTLFDSIDFEFIEYSDKVDHVCLCGGGGSINYDYRRLTSDKSALISKAQKYLTLIAQSKHPYIICLYLDFHTWFDKRDVYKALYGSSTEHLEHTVYYSHMIKDSLYYSSKGLMKNVSGVLLRQNDEHSYYHNFSNNNLNEVNRELLLKWQHPYE